MKGADTRCSFSDFSRCHRTIFTKKRKLKPVDEDTKQILAGRTCQKIAQCNIKSICPHHEQELLVKFKFSHPNKKRKCANPLNLAHVCGRKSTFRKVSKDLIARHNLEYLAEVGDDICHKCRKKLEEKSQKKPAEWNPDQPSTSGTVGQDQSSTSSAQVISSPSTAPSRASVERSQHLEDVINAAGESPIQKGTCCAVFSYNITTVLIQVCIGKTIVVID